MCIRYRVKNFNTSHVSVRFAAGKKEEARELYFNTSHVSVRCIGVVEYSTVAAFQYISCVGSMYTLPPAFHSLSISIHLMCRFDIMLKYL